jgi:hypothetical protein
MISLNSTVRELIELLEFESVQANDLKQYNQCREALGHLDHILPLHQAQEQDLAIRKCLKVISEGGE